MTEATTAMEAVMPKLSDSMEQGLILSWLKSEGERVEIGDDLVEIETDKATMTYQAEAAGYLRIVAQEGEEIAIGGVVAQLLPEPEAPVDGSSQTGEVDTRPPPEPPPPRAEASAPVAEAGVPAPPDPGSQEQTGPGGRARISPLAKRMAEKTGIELTSVVGSGPGGRIVIADIRSAAGLPKASEAFSPQDRSSLVSAAPVPRASRESDESNTPAPPSGNSGGGADTARGAVNSVQPTRVEQVIARRMAEAKATIPEFSMRVDVRIDRLLTLRQEILGGLESESVPSINDFVVKAVAIALRRHSKVNGAYRDGRFDLYERINVGVAVAAPDGLYVPTVFDADRKSLGEIARTTRALIKRARLGELTPQELAGGTFTISNLGMYGISDFVPIINPPQAAILAVGAIKDVLVRVEGEVADQHTMPLTLVGDHRILNGSEAAEFLAGIVETLEQPLLAATA